VASKLKPELHCKKAMSDALWDIKVLWSAHSILAMVWTVSDALAREGTGFFGRVDAGIPSQWTG